MKTQALRMHRRTGPAGQPHVGEKQRLWRKTDTDSNLSSTTRSCVTLAKLHNLSGPQHPEPKIGNSSLPSCQGCCGDEKREHRAWGSCPLQSLGQWSNPCRKGAEFSNLTLEYSSCVISVNHTPSREPPSSNKPPSTHTHHEPSPVLHMCWP